MTPGITLNATLQTLAGGPATGYKLKITLVNYGSEAPGIPGVGLFLPLAQTSNFVTASLTLTLWGNDQISPAGTRYLVQLTDSTGSTVYAANEYELLGVSTLDLSLLTPYTELGPGSTGQIYVIQVLGGGGPITDPVTQLQYTVGVINGVVTALPVGAVAQLILADSDGSLQKFTVANGALQIVAAAAGSSLSSVVTLIDTVTGDHVSLVSTGESVEPMVVASTVAGVALLPFIDSVTGAIHIVKSTNLALTIT